MMDYNFVEKYINKLKFISRKVLLKKKYESSMVSIKLAANILYNVNQRYTDKDIENYILRLRDCIFENTNDYKRDTETIFFYDGFGLDLRGWAASYVRALTKLGYFLVYMCPVESTIPNILSEMNTKNSKVIYLSGSNLEKSITINEVFKNYKPGTAFFYTTPSDVSAAIAFSNNPKTVRIQVDLTDHAYWIGLNAFDYIRESREMGASIAVYQRGIEKRKILKSDCTPYISNSICNEDLPFDITKEKYIFTGGSLYKTLGDNDLLYYKTIRYILTNYSEIIFLYAGQGDSSEIEKLSKEFPKRVFLISERPDFFEIIKNCILYINSYPMFGGLMMRYAALASKIPITLKHGNDSDGLLLNQSQLGIQFNEYSEYIAEIDQILMDDEYRCKKEQLLRNSVYDEEMFARDLDLIIRENRSESSFNEIRNLDTTEFRKEYLRRYNKKMLYKNIAAKSNICLIRYFPKEFIIGALIKLKEKLK